MHSRESSRPSTSIFGASLAVPSRLLALVLLAALVLSGCQALQPVVSSGAQAAGTTPVPSASTSVQPTATPDQSQAYTAKIEFSPSKAEVGKTVDVRGTGYPAGADVDLVWYTAQGRYQVDGGTEFAGQRFDQVSSVVAAVRADQSGAISTTLQVPLDFGGSHDVRGRVGGKEISQAGLTILPTFSLTPSEGPVGTPIEVKIVGVDWRTNVNSWQVLYDTSYLGFMSAVTTKGVAIAHIRASGTVGDHRISLWHNSYNPTPYLNWPQGPYKDTPGGALAFRVTSGTAAGEQRVEAFSSTDNPWPLKDAGTGKLALSVVRGVVSQTTTLSGSALPANKTLSLLWWTMVGNRVSSTGFTEQSRPLGDVQTGADGTFVKDLAIPDDLGGQHRIEVRDGDKLLAAAGIVIEPSIVSISPTKVRAGEAVKIHLKGVGWTTIDNTYGVTYDNAYIGYVCGFSTNGDVQFTITASGAPGTHIIDLYPTIYKGQDAMPKVYSVPQLTYADDHPQRITPAIRLSIEITE